MVTPVTLPQVANNMKDVLRYTITFKTRNYTAGVNTAQSPSPA